MNDNTIAALENELSLLRDMNDHQLDTINALRRELRELQARYNSAAMLLQNAEMEGLFG